MLAADKLHLLLPCFWTDSKTCTKSVFHSTSQATGSGCWKVRAVSSNISLPLARLRSSWSLHTWALRCKTGRQPPSLHLFKGSKRSCRELQGHLGLGPSSRLVGHSGIKAVSTEANLMMVTRDSRGTKRRPAKGQQSPLLHLFKSLLGCWNWTMAWEDPGKTISEH